MSYDPSKLDYETVCESIGHLYLELSHYRSLSDSRYGQINNLSQNIKSLTEKICSLENENKENGQEEEDKAGQE